MSRALSLIAAGVVVSVLPAQQIVDRNLRVNVPVPTAASQLPRPFDLFADALAIDQGVEHWWYYRLDGDTRESALTTVGGVSPNVRASATHADRDFTDLDARGLLKANQDFDVYSTGPASGVVLSRMTLMNISNSPLTVDLFAYADVDVAGTFFNDTCTGTTTSHFVSDGTGIQIEVRAPGADRSDVAAWPALRDLLSDGNLDDLANVHPPFAGNYTGAFQWEDRTLQPFEQLTFTLVFAIDTVANIPPLIEHYGAANGSTFEIDTVELPLQDNSQPRAFRVRIKNALPNAIHRMVVGLTPWPALPFIPGIDLWIDPLSIIAVYGGLTSATGTAELSYLIPPSPYLAGISAYFQGFYVDAAAPNGFAYFTSGMHIRIGKL